MKIKSFSALLLVLIFYQTISALPHYFSFQLEKKAESISAFSDSDQILSSAQKFNRRVPTKLIEYKIVLKEESVEADKGNSGFYIYNQLLPKDLLLIRLFPCSVTSYFSSSV